MQTGGTMSLKTTTTFTTRRPTLIRVWRTNGAQLTNTWLPAIVPNTRLNDEGGPRL
jgi:hypothetical protein